MMRKEPEDNKKNNIEDKPKKPYRSTVILSLLAILRLVWTMPLMGCVWDDDQGNEWVSGYYDCWEGGFSHLVSLDGSESSYDHRLLSCGHYACDYRYGLQACGEHCVCEGGGPQPVRLWLLCL